MNATKLTAEQTAAVLERFSVYRNAGSYLAGKWVYQPHDYDSSFALWSEGYKTKREAMTAAYAEMMDPAMQDDGEHA